jgi:hypothetical protein
MSTTPYLGQAGQALRFSKRPKIRRTVRAATAPKIPKGISRISRRTFLKVRNQEGRKKFFVIAMRRGEERS